MVRASIAGLASLLLAGCEFSSDLNERNLHGYEFNLFEIQKYCTVTRHGDKHLGFNCERDELSPVARGCEGLLTAGLKDPKLLCGGGLWILQDICHIQMTGANTGNIICRK